MLLLIPMAWLYTVIFGMVLKLKANIDAKYHQDMKDGQSIDLSTTRAQTPTNHEIDAEKDRLENDEAKENVSLTLESFKVVMKFSGITILNLAAVNSN